MREIGDEEWGLVFRRLLLLFRKLFFSLVLRDRLNIVFIGIIPSGRDIRVHAKPALK